MWKGSWWGRKKIRRHSIDVAVPWYQNLVSWSDWFKHWIWYLLTALREMFGRSWQQLVNNFCWHPESLRAVHSLQAWNSRHLRVVWEILCNILSTSLIFRLLACLLRHNEKASILTGLIPFLTICNRLTTKSGLAHQKQAHVYSSTCLAPGQFADRVHIFMLVEFSSTATRVCYILSNRAQSLRLAGRICD